MSRLAIAISLAAFAFAISPCSASDVDPLLPKEVAEGVYVGALPDDATWRALRRLGVLTAVGVDGLPPDEMTARRHGIRVVHIPIGYDGIDAPAMGQLAAVAQKCDRPIYVYCHHGRYRGPAAAAVICRAAGLIDKRGADALRNRFSDGTQHSALWGDALRFDPPPADAELPTLVERGVIPPFRLAMSQLDRAWSQRLTATDPDLRRESQRLVLEYLNESKRAAKADPKSPAAMIGLLHEAINAWPPTEEMRPQDLEQFESASCLGCHERFRD